MKATRREFLRHVGCGAMTAAAVATGVPQLFQMNALAAPGAGDTYKALVCIFLLGGNDSNNTVIPLDDYGSYAAVRAGLTIPHDLLLPIAPPSARANFGLHPQLTLLHELWQQKRLAVVANVGPLVVPLTPDEYRNTPSLRPYQLFSHSDQQAEWQTSNANGFVPTGWGGRLADLTRDSTTGFPTVASMAGLTIFSAGSTTSPLVLPPAPTALNQALALKRPGDTADGSDLRQLVDLRLTNTAPTLIEVAAAVQAQAIHDSLALSVDPVLTTSFPNTPLGNQLKQAAKLMKLSASLGLRRQIFFCAIGGFDTHTDQGSATGTQANLLKSLSDAMGAFYDATVELGLAAQVTTFTMSDFSRTFKPAGAGAATGSDHAWGAHHFVLGGAVLGGDFYGTYPTLALSGPDDTDQESGARGRWVPTIAVDQYAATLATWFGVAAGDLELVFPNLRHFANPNLGFLM
jgi:uncharacterized protein (DUF1501 family)